MEDRRLQAIGTEEEEEVTYDDEAAGAADSLVEQRQCRIRPFVEDRFSPDNTFRNTASIRFVHYQIPRFGHTSNITQFIAEKLGTTTTTSTTVTGSSTSANSSNGEDGGGYIRGLASCCIAIVVVAVTWVLLLFICKFCLGPSRVGWLSGRFRPLPPRPRTESSSLSLHQDKKDLEQEEEDEDNVDNQKYDGPASSGAVGKSESSSFGRGDGQGSTEMDEETSRVSSSSDRVHETEEQRLAIGERNSVDESSSTSNQSQDHNIQEPCDNDIWSLLSVSQQNALRLIHDLDAAFHLSFTNNTTDKDSNDNINNQQGKNLDTTKVTDEPTTANEKDETASNARPRTRVSSSDDTSLAIPPSTAPVETTSLELEPTTARIKSILTGQMMSPPAEVTRSYYGSDRDCSDNLEDFNDSASLHLKHSYHGSQQLFCDQDKVKISREEIEAWFRRYHKIEFIRSCFRTICWFCALAVIVGTILMIIQGAEYMKSTINNVVVSLSLGQDLALQTSDLVVDVINGIERIQNDTIALLLSFNGICPLVRQRVCEMTVEYSDSKCEAVDSNITLMTLYDEWRRDQGDDGDDSNHEWLDDDSFKANETTLHDKTMMLRDFDYQTASSKVVDALTGTTCKGLQIGTYLVCNATGILTGIFAEQLAEKVSRMTRLQSDLHSFNNDIMSIYELMEDAKNTAHSFDWALSLAMFFMVLSATVGLFFLCVLTFYQFASSRTVQCIQNRWIFPLFLLFTFLSLIFTCTFLVGSMAVSDFCVNGPEANLLVIAGAFGANVQSRFVPRKTAYELCKNPPSTLQILKHVLDENDQVVFGIEQELANLSQRISTTCGTDESGALFLSVFSTKIREYLCGVTNLARRFRELVRCSNIYPLYEQVMHQTVCFAGSDAFWWMAATNFIVVVVSLLLLTFRSAFFPIEIDHEDSRQKAAKDPNDVNSDEKSNGMLRIDSKLDES